MEHNDAITMGERTSPNMEQLKRLLRSRDESTRATAVQHLRSFKPSRALPLLMDALTDESLMVRQRAIDVLVVHGKSDRAVILELVNQLASSDASVRSGALDALVRLGRAAVDELCNALDDENVDRRILAATALGSIAEPSATDALLAHLNDPNENVRHTVIEALGNIGDERATEPLMAVAHHADWQLRIAAINSLGQLRDERAVDLLLSMLDDELLRYAIIDALGAIADSRAAGALITFIGSPDAELHIRARHALVQIGQFVEWWGRLIDADSIKRFRQALGEVTVDGINALYEDALSEDEDIRAEACYLLGTIPSKAAAEALVKLLDVPSASHHALEMLPTNPYGWYALCKLWCNSPHQLKSEWLNALQEARAELPPKGIKWLLELIHSGAPDIQSSALRILAMQPAHVDIPIKPILDASHHESPSVRAAATLVLSRWNELQVCERLMNLIGDEDALVRSTALESIVKLPVAHPGLLIEILIRALEDPSPQVRATAARAADSILIKGINGSLRERLRWSLGDEDAAVRIAALETLTNHVALQERVIFIPMLNDPVESVRYAAARALMGTGDAFASQLLPLMDGARPLTCIAACLALQGACASEVMEAALKLLDVGDEEVMSAALTVLANAKEPAIVERVRELTNHPSWLVRANAVRAFYGLGAMDAPTAQNVARNALCDEHYAVRNAATEVLAEWGTAEDVESVAQLALKRETSEAALKALREMAVRYPEAVAKLNAHPRTRMRMIGRVALAAVEHSSGR